MNKKYRLRETNILLLLLVAAMIVLIVPQAVRYYYFDNTMAGDESYYHLRVAKSIIQTGIPANDLLITGGREYVLNPYHIFLAAVILVFGSFTANILPLLLGISCFLLFHAILKEFGIEPEKRFFILVIFLVSPIFISLFTTLNMHSLIVVLDLLGLYIFIKNKKISFACSLLVFVFASMFGWFYSLVLLMALFVISLHMKRMKHFFAAFVVIVAVTSVFHFSFYFFRDMGANLLQRSITQELITGLGAKLGFSAFALALALVGFVASWKMKRKFYIFYLAVVILIMFFIYKSDDVNVYLNFIFSVLAGIGLYTLIKMKWELETVKMVVLIILGCGLLFSCLSQIRTVAASMPDKETMASLAWLKDSSLEHEGVFSHYTNGFWIEYSAERPVFIDSLFGYTPDISRRHGISNNISRSRRIVEAKKMLDDNNLDYVWINKEMKSGLVWEEADEGLLFLFRDNQTFRRIYQSDNIEIWKVVGNGVS